MYCQVADLIARFGEAELIQLTDRNLVGQIDEVVVARAIDDAKAEIDGYLRSRYQLPLSPVPPALVRVACDIARYHLCAQVEVEAISRRYRDATKLLVALARGDASIGMEASEPAPVAQTVQMVSGGRVFGRDAEGL